ncbi:EI24 domain-containing protein [Sphingomonas japonica]|uniref:Uncharacterized protein involved in cysteine biosynthesis n=1 Tax=Sphingomonas japonica TaxID=511662 RepID=A0ABX0TYD1_9SPHN|nr:EI24 domain-containing protein [Sphingomonas japonica]NIJ23244.1 uncharacterized protein involved in cysteine biosynthesis [Sphingomonas japonica]
MVRALALSIAQLGDRPVLAVLLKSLLVTVLLFGVVGFAGWVGARAVIDAFGWDARWRDLAGIAAVALVAGGAWLVFRAVAIAVVGIFADDVVEAVERRHYPDRLATARPVSLMRGIGMGLGSAARTILVNVAMLPVYILLLVTGIGTAIAFFAVNGWLLGRDLGDMVAARHVARDHLPAWRGSTRGSRLLLGLGVTALFVIPVVNLFAPVLGAAMATHLFHRRPVA